MATSIQWTDETINFWMGCQKVSAGCKYCYMYRDMAHYGKDATVVRLVQEKTIFNKLRKLAPGSKIFTCSWSDFFIEDADQWRARAWEIIRQHPQFIWQILTKRPERIKQCLPDDWGNGYANVWLGVSVEHQEAANERIPILIDIPAAVRFLSCEPLLSPVRIYTEPLDRTWTDKIHWVILGGESGNDNGKYLYRPCEFEWIRDLAIQCKVHDVPVFVKQYGTHIAKQWGLKDRHGGNIEEWPEAPDWIRKFPIQQVITNSNYDMMMYLYNMNAGKEVETHRYVGVVCGFHFSWGDGDRNTMMIAITEEKVVAPGTRAYLRGDVPVTHKRNPLGYGYVDIDDFPAVGIKQPKGYKAGCDRPQEHAGWNPLTDF